MSADETVTVALGARAYRVMIGDGLIERAADLIGPNLRRPFAPIVTDDRVAPLWAARLEGALGEAGIATTRITVTAGEASKSWATLARLCDELLAARVERTDHLIALGGGMVGDLAGFAAAIVKRGMGVIQMPTTLLAQVDSSVGGKTGINTAAGKNMVGAFHQPALVLADSATLASLPPRELRAGYAEVVKYGLLGDAAFFAWLERHGAALLAGDPALIRHAVATSVAAKARIVAADERETGDVRALLNLGHTFGHALEGAAGYDGSLLHGEAVAAGMALAFGFATATGRCDPQAAQRVSAHLTAVGLPTTLAAAGIALSGTALADRMADDKKAAGGNVPFILPSAIGAVAVVRDVPLAAVAAYLDTPAARGA